MYAIIVHPRNRHRDHPTTPLARGWPAHGHGWRRCAIVLLALALIPAGRPSRAAAEPIDPSRVEAARLVGAPAPTGRGAWVADVVLPVAARVAPRRSARVRMRLDPYGDTMGGEIVLLVTGAYRTARGGDWLRVLLPQRPNRSMGWIPADAAVLARRSVRVEVILMSRTIEIWRGPTRLGAFPAGIGRDITPTPVGTFAVWERWYAPSGDRAAYGSRVLSLTAHSGVLRRWAGADARIAIHGTGNPRRIGRRSSHGCIVVSESVLRLLWRTMAPGSPVRIRRT